MLQRTDRAHKPPKAGGAQLVYPVRSEPVFTARYVDAATDLGVKSASVLFGDKREVDRPKSRWSAGLRNR